jgi:hypothetical protein
MDDPACSPYNEATVGPMISGHRLVIDRARRPT